MKLDLITNKAQIIQGGGVNPNDEFYTPRYAIEPLLKYLKPNSFVWCPFDTEESNFVKMLREEGHKVECSHIGEGKDFFIEIEKLKTVGENYQFDYIISNPPYSLKGEVFEKLFKSKIPFAMLVGVVGLFESKFRFDLFANNNFEIMYFNKRISYFKSYIDQKPSLNPPFSSVYICKDLLPKKIVFETIDKNNDSQLKMKL